MEKGSKIVNRAKPIDEIDGLTAVQLKAIELLLDGELNKGQIAKEIGVHRNSITNWLKNDMFKAALEECATEKKKQTINFINSKALEAAQKYWALTDCGDNKTKCAVLQDWLNRAVGKPNSKVEFTDTRENQEDYDIESAMKRLQEESSTIIPMRKNA